MPRPQLRAHTHDALHAGTTFDRQHASSVEDGYYSAEVRSNRMGVGNQKIWERWDLMRVYTVGILYVEKRTLSNPTF